MYDLSGNEKTKMTIANMPTTLETKKVLYETPSKGIEIRKERRESVSKRSEPRKVQKMVTLMGLVTASWLV